ncbi:MAG TPA: hypothetical protein VMF32_11280 [Xanthobacteraceae bacterium]|nr:hypothetical protein [Xanthobacteraceae bacterium]
MKVPSGSMCRTATVLLALLLAAQAIWLVFTQSLQPQLDRLPTDPGTATRAALDRANAERAASIADIRGDLWAQAAFTYADLLWGPATADARRTEELAKAHAMVMRSLDRAPHNSEVWLLAAGLASRYPSPQAPNTIQALKMSYYTGPSEQRIMALRFRLAAGSDFAGDVEMREFIARDLRLLLEQKQKPEITAAYLEASPADKQFIEKTIKDLDPSAASWLHASDPLLLPN